MMAATVTPIRGMKSAPKAYESKMDTIIATQVEVDSWQLPPFQRNFKHNKRVDEVVEELKQNGGVITGVIHLGTVPPAKTRYIVDGQHRLQAFRMSGLPECIMDVRLYEFANMGAMAEEFVKLNTPIARFGADDVLRGMEPLFPVLGKIREMWPFVGYGTTRRGSDGGAILGMSQLLRAWEGSRGETPSSGHHGMKPGTIAEQLVTEEGFIHFAGFMNAADKAWGRDPQHYRLWGTLNLTMCMWLYRHIVIDRERGTKRYVTITWEEFKKGLMALSADHDYLDWLPGRLMGERDRSPAYARIRNAFAKRLSAERGEPIRMPQPIWFSNRTDARR